MKRLAILGAGGHGKVIADVAELSGWAEIFFYDDTRIVNSVFGHWKVLGNTKALLQSLDRYDGVIVAIGNNAVRYQKTVLLMEHKAPLVNIRHPSAQISKYSKIGPGSAIFASVVVNVDVTIGFSAILNTACSVDHDCQLGDCVHISPGVNLSGGVIVGDRTWIGVGACAKQSLQIGADVLIGAGSVVVKDILKNSIVAGNPAKPFKEI